MSVKITVNGEVLTAYLDGEIDHHSAGVMRNEIDAAVEKNIPSMLVLDFRAVSFMDSSGIGIIIGRYRKISCFGGKVYAINTSERIQRLLRSSGLSSIIEIIA